MRGGRLLRRGIGGARHASGRAAPPRRARPGILAAEREPLRAQAQTRHAVRHVLLQRVEEAHLSLSLSLSLSQAETVLRDNPIVIAFLNARQREEGIIVGSNTFGHSSGHG